MKNRFVLCYFSILLHSVLLTAQTPVIDRQAEFTVSVDGQTVTLTPQMPPLVQMAGAQPAYWEYFWEFGDGSFLRTRKPSHTHNYAEAGDYIVSLDAVAHYDNGKRAKVKNKKVKTVKTAARSQAMAATEMPDVFDKEKKVKQAVAMAASNNPKAEEAMTCIVSYRNNGTVTTDGRLYLFFNEKKFPTSHFLFDTARTHFGETPDQSYSCLPPEDALPAANWVTLPRKSYGGTFTLLADEPPPFNIVEDIVTENRRTYREENAWRFSSLRPGEKRNLFVSLAGTKNMIRDTTAFIHLEAVFAPFDPAIAPERFVMEVKIVASHDPNAIAVSDNRVNYRTLGSKKLEYEVQFQNNGEGPASTVELKVEIPNGLNMARMRPVKWYPDCPVCPEEPGRNSCLDTASSKTGLTFTFRNIYLPGSRQEGVEKYDSTKGYVKYRIEAEKDMPKLSFSSRARIVFDKNPPIYTNYTKTRFKPGLSPGIKFGYHTLPDDKHSNYFFAGVSISPFKSWRVYPQVELLTGIRLKDEISAETYSDSIPLGFADGPDGKVAFRYALIDSIVKEKRGFTSFELPVLLRKNFSRFFGAGIGGSARITLENGEHYNCIHGYLYSQDIETKVVNLVRDSIIDRTTYYSDTRADFTAFADFTFGSVRAGPNLGIRAGAIMSRRKTRAFLQASLEWKF
jgi:PKD repeat protein